MNPNELNVAIAKILGWTCEMEDRYWPNRELVWRNHEGFGPQQLDFTHNRQRLGYLLKEIERRNLQYEYINNLLDCGDSVLFDTEQVFQALMVWPETYCYAFVKTIQENEKKG